MSMLRTELGSSGRTAEVSIFLAPADRIVQHGETIGKAGEMPWWVQASTTKAEELNYTLRTHSGWRKERTVFGVHTER